MDIHSNLVARAYTANKPATAPDPSADAGTAFGQATGSFIETLKQSEQISMQAMTAAPILTLSFKPWHKQSWQ